MMYEITGIVIINEKTGKLILKTGVNGSWESTLYVETSELDRFRLGQQVHCEFSPLKKPAGEAA